MKLILIRHGKTAANEKHLYCGATDLPLSEGGRKALEVRKTEGVLPSLGGIRVLTSGLRRCEETLAILYGDIPHETEPRFRVVRGEEGVAACYSADGRPAMDLRSGQYEFIIHDHQ